MKRYLVWYKDGTVQVIMACDAVCAIKQAWALRPYSWEVHSVYFLELYIKGRE